MGVRFDPLNHQFYIDYNAPAELCLAAENLLAGTIIRCGHNYSTVYPEMDFETYSEAGYLWDEEQGRYVELAKNVKGLSAVGAAFYAQHHSTEVLKLAYNLKDGLGPRLWEPGMAPPADLIAHILNGGIVEAHNSGFEFLIWFHVCHLRMGWPFLPLEQLRCSMAKAAAYGLPGGLEKLAAAINAPIQKDTDGADIMKKVTVPKAPSAKDKSIRYTPVSHPQYFARLGTYCVNDTRAEGEVSAMLPDLSPDELDLWLLDQKINMRGAPVDVKALDDCIAIVEQAMLKYTSELQNICGGSFDARGEWEWDVETANEVAGIRAFLAAKGLNTTDLKKPTVDALLKRSDLTPVCRRVLELRSILGASSVKKLWSLVRRKNSDDRVRGLFAYCGADRTGRFAGRGPQPQNFPSGGPTLQRCDRVNGCGHHYGGALLWCPWCGAGIEYSDADVEWNPVAMEQAFKVIASRNLSYVEHYFGDPIDVVSGCLRGLFHASEGRDFVCSDFSAIEAVVAAEISGETWRQEVFRSHGKIYEASAAQTFGVPLSEILDYKKRTGSHHPLRKKGKVGELAAGYGGWIGAYRNFGAEGTDKELKTMVLAWRAASPMIVEMWGGQWRDHGWNVEPTPEFFGLEGAAIQAVLNPGVAFGYRDISYQTCGDVLHCRLPSGRLLSYHQPRLYQVPNRFNKRDQWQLTYMGQSSTSKNTSGGWIRLDTYGGKLFENVVQAIARDILTFAMRNLERAGYWIVLHVHDEIVSEVAEGWGSIEEFERIMSTMPPWAAGWPVKAAGGWRGKRYRKE